MSGMNRERQRAVLARSIGAIEPLEARRLLSTTWYVDTAASGASHDGTSWNSAYTDLQQALAAATAGDAIHVAQGTYKPTSTTDRTISFQLKSGVEVDGGYMGSTSPTPDARDIAAYPTILSGDIGAVGSNTDNSYHIVTATDVASGTALDGLTFTEANASPWSYSIPNSGGGIYCGGGVLVVRQSNFTANAASGGGAIYFNNAEGSITDCTFTGNSSYAGNYAGGAIGASRLSHVTVEESNFTSNSSGSGGAAISAYRLTINSCAFVLNSGQLGAVDAETLVAHQCSFVDNTTQFYGAAISFPDGSGATEITGCSFMRNRAVYGGAIGGYYTDGKLAAADCTFTGNTAEDGGAVRIAAGAQASVAIDDCLFSGNVATRYGGAVRIEPYIGTSTTPTLRLNNCTFAFNLGLYGCTLSLGGESTGTIQNCILYGGQEYQIFTEAIGTLSIEYSLVKPAFSGAGNIDADPMFYRNPSPGADGTWGTGDDDYGDLRLQPGSPCIDAGSNSAVPSDLTTDLDGNPRILDFPGVHDPGAIVDMGAYEAFDLDGMHLTAGQHLVLPAGHHVFSASGLIIDPGATLDIKDNSLIINYPGASSRLGSWDSSTGQYNGLTGQIQSGAIFSSLARPGRTTPGIAAASNLFGISGSQTATWGGQTVGSIDVLIKFTYVGDANLDGKVNIDDYGRIDANVGQSGSVFGWYAGDFNLDGKINIDDYGLIDSIIGAQGPVL
jgi:hypothetical protein